MRIDWKRVHTLYLIIIVLLGIATFVVGRSFILQPIKDDIETSIGTLQSEKQILRTMEDKVKDDVDISLQTSKELQRVVPVLPVTDQLLIGMERAENVSGSFIRTYDHAGDNELMAEDFDLIEDQQNEEQSSEDDVDLEESNSNAIKEPSEGEPVSRGSVLDGVHEATFTLKVLSPSFVELMSFLEELQRLPRLVSIDAITFEAQDVVTEENPLEYEVTLSAFYVPSLVALQPELPQYHYASPAGKENPLPVGADVPVGNTSTDDENEEEDEDREIERPPSDNEDQSNDEGDSDGNSNDSDEDIEELS
ncbi:hypothetical protein N781_10595 [Pontibacillus halophilus JSM 076056 = DSM 19796]|uniref:Pilus assembly protein PilO n=1 Tax=Pontibacillus halophilus JSM 076056 = DSM 19796 TaxID=1385510 RepID=A0A0A5ICQ7_9BACI|nr:hypothetical protein [Pontibacillus halophilus]KGX93627.1 hypothetical protein N781_10595 [Pontibacillus halophilus JSM 076056 = DSM 19796]